MGLLPRGDSTRGGQLGGNRAMTEIEQPRLADEMEKMEYEPLLGVEKKLIVWSITLGIVLLAVLTWVSYTFFPAP